MQQTLFVKNQLSGTAANYGRRPSAAVFYYSNGRHVIQKNISPLTPTVAIWVQL